MALIPLHGKKGAGLFAIVDDALYPILKLWRWTLHSKGYAYAKVMDIRGYSVSAGRRQKAILMHHLVLDPRWAGLDPDHINGDKLDNRRVNLRVATRVQNNGNTSGWGRRASPFKGVTFHKKTGQWAARMSRDYRNVHLGLFVSPEEAARAYDVAARQYFGPFAKTNF